MSARREEALYNNIANNVLSERVDIINYVPTKKDVFVVSETIVVMSNWR